MLNAFRRGQKTVVSRTGLSVIIENDAALPCRAIRTDVPSSDPITITVQISPLPQIPLISHRRGDSGNVNLTDVNFMPGVTETDGERSSIYKF